MLKDQVQRYLNQYLGEYIIDPEHNNLSVSVVRGEIHLKNVQIKQEAVELLNLPFQLLLGEVDDLTIKIPWMVGFGSRPVAIELNGLRLRLGLKPDRLWSEDEELRRVQLKRQKLIDWIDLESDLKSGDTTDDSRSGDERRSVFARVATRVRDNVEVDLRNLHLTLEDAVSGGTGAGTRTSPFCIGLHIDAWKIRTTNEEWKPMFVERTKERSQRLFKVSDTKKICVYHVLGPAAEERRWHVESLADDEHVLKEVSTRLRLSHNLDTADTTNPRFSLCIDSEDIKLSLTRASYEALFCIMAVVSEYQAFQEVMRHRILTYWPHRPQASPPCRGASDAKESAGHWWRYFVRCALLSLDAPDQSAATQNLWPSSVNEVPAGGLAALVTEKNMTRLRLKKVYCDLVRRGKAKELSPDEEVRMTWLQDNQQLPDILRWRAMALEEVQEASQEAQRQEAATKPAGERSTWSRFFPRATPDRLSLSPRTSPEAQSRHPRSMPSVPSLQDVTVKSDSGASSDFGNITTTTTPSPATLIATAAPRDIMASSSTRFSSLQADVGDDDPAHAARQRFLTGCAEATFSLMGGIDTSGDVPGTPESQQRTLERFHTGNWEAQDADESDVEDTLANEINEEDAFALSIGAHFLNREFKHLPSVGSWYQKLRQHTKPRFQDPTVASSPAGCASVQATASSHCVEDAASGTVGSSGSPGGSSDPVLESVAALAVSVNTPQGQVPRIAERKEAWTPLREALQVAKAAFAEVEAAPATSRAAAWAACDASWKAAAAIEEPEDWALHPSAGSAIHRRPEREERFQRLPSVGTWLQVQCEPFDREQLLEAQVATQQAAPRGSYFGSFMRLFGRGAPPPAAAERKAQAVPGATPGVAAPDTPKASTGSPEVHQHATDRLKDSEHDAATGDSESALPAAAASGTPKSPKSGSSGDERGWLARLFGSGTPGPAQPLPLVEAAQDTGAQSQAGPLAVPAPAETSQGEGFAALLGGPTPQTPTQPMRPSEAFVESNSPPVVAEQRQEERSAQHNQDPATPAAEDGSLPGASSPTSGVPSHAATTPSGGTLRFWSRWFRAGGAGNEAVDGANATAIASPAGGGSGLASTQVGEKGTSKQASGPPSLPDLTDHASGSPSIAGEQQPEGLDGTSECSTPSRAQAVLQRVGQRARLTGSPTAAEPEDSPLNTASASPRMTPTSGQTPRQGLFAGEQEWLRLSFILPKVVVELETRKHMKTVGKATRLEVNVGMTDEVRANGHVESLNLASGYECYDWKRRRSRASRVENIQLIYLEHEPEETCEAQIAEVDLEPFAQTPGEREQGGAPTCDETPRGGAPISVTYNSSTQDAQGQPEVTVTGRRLILDYRQELFAEITNFLNAQGLTRSRGFDRWRRRAKAILYSRGRPRAKFELDNITVIVPTRSLTLGQAPIDAPLLKLYSRSIKADSNELAGDMLTEEGWPVLCSDAWTIALEGLQLKNFSSHAASKKDLGWTIFDDIALKHRLLFRKYELPGGRKRFFGLAEPRSVGISVDVDGDAQELVAALSMQAYESLIRVLRLLIRGPLPDVQHIRKDSDFDSGVSGGTNISTISSDACDVACVVSDTGDGQQHAPETTLSEVQAPAHGDLEDDDPSVHLSRYFKERALSLEPARPRFLLKVLVERVVMRFYCLAEDSSPDSSCVDLICSPATLKFALRDDYITLGIDTDTFEMCGPCSQNASGVQSLFRSVKADGEDPIALTITIPRNAEAKAIHSKGADMLIGMTLDQSHVVFSPRPIRELIRFAKSTPPAEPVPVIGETEVPSGEGDESLDPLQYCIDVGFRGATFVWVDEARDLHFAESAMEQSNVRLDLYEKTVGFHGSFRNFTIEDRTSQFKPRILGPQAGAEYDFLVSARTFIPNTAQFSGYHTSVKAEMPSVDLVYFGAKFVRCWRWVFGAFLPTLRAPARNPSTVIPDESGKSASSDDGSDSGFHSCDDGETTVEAPFLSVPHTSIANLSCLEQFFAHSDEATWFAPGEQAWKQAKEAQQLACGKGECELPPHLTFTRIEVDIVNPVITMPLKTAGRPTEPYVRLRANRIRVSNAPCHEQNKRDLWDVTTLDIQDARLESSFGYTMFGPRVGIVVQIKSAYDLQEFLNGIKTQPPMPMHVSIRFQEYPLSLTSRELALLRAVFSQNIAGEDPDVPLPPPDPALQEDPINTAIWLKCTLKMRGVEVTMQDSTVANISQRDFMSFALLRADELRVAIDKHTGPCVEVAFGFTGVYLYSLSMVTLCKPFNCIMAPLQQDVPYENLAGTYTYAAPTGQRLDMKGSQPCLVVSMPVLWRLFGLPFPVKPWFPGPVSKPVCDSFIVDVTFRDGRVILPAAPRDPQSQLFAVRGNFQYMSTSGNNAHEWFIALQGRDVLKYPFWSAVSEESGGSSPSPSGSFEPHVRILSWDSQDGTNCSTCLKWTVTNSSLSENHRKCKKTLKFLPGRMRLSDRDCQLCKAAWNAAFGPPEIGVADIVNEAKDGNEGDSKEVLGVHAAGDSANVGDELAPEMEALADDADGGKAGDGTASETKAADLPTSSADPQAVAPEVDEEFEVDMKNLKAELSSEQGTNLKAPLLKLNMPSAMLKTDFTHATGKLIKKADIDVEGIEIFNSPAQKWEPLLEGRTTQQDLYHLEVTDMQNCETLRPPTASMETRRSIRLESSANLLLNLSNASLHTILTHQKAWSGLVGGGTADPVQNPPAIQYSSEASRFSVRNDTGLDARIRVGGRGGSSGAVLLEAYGDEQPLEASCGSPGAAGAAGPGAVGVHHETVSVVLCGGNEIGSEGSTGGGAVRELFKEVSKVSLFRAGHQVFALAPLGDRHDPRQGMATGRASTTSTMEISALAEQNTTGVPYGGVRSRSLPSRQPRHNTPTTQSMSLPYLICRVPPTTGPHVLLLESPVLVQNELNVSVLLQFQDASFTRKLELAPGKTAPVPINACQQGEIRVKPILRGQSGGKAIQQRLAVGWGCKGDWDFSQPISLSEIYQGKSADMTIHCRCAPVDTIYAQDSDFHVTFACSTEELKPSRYLRAAQHRIQLRPPITLFSTLPVPVQFKVSLAPAVRRSRGSSTWTGLVDPGKREQIFSFRYGQRNLGVQRAAPTLAFRFVHSDSSSASCSETDKDQWSEPVDISDTRRSKEEVEIKLPMPGTDQRLVRLLLVFPDREAEPGALPELTIHAKAWIVNHVWDQGCTFMNPWTGPPPGFSGLEGLQGHVTLLHCHPKKLTAAELKARRFELVDGTAITIDMKGSKLELGVTVVENVGDLLFKDLKVFNIVPRIVIVNATARTLCVRQAQASRLATGNEVRLLMPGDRRPFHWTTLEHALEVRLDEEGWRWSGKLLMKESCCEYAFQVQRQASSGSQDDPCDSFENLRIESRSVEATSFIIIRPDVESLAAYKIVNKTTQPLRVRQARIEGRAAAGGRAGGSDEGQERSSLEVELQANMSIPWAWFEPNHPKKIEVRCGSTPTRSVTTVTFGLRGEKGKDEDCNRGFVKELGDRTMDSYRFGGALGSRSRPSASRVEYKVFQSKSTVVLEFTQESHSREGSTGKDLVELRNLDLTVVLEDVGVSFVAPLARATATGSRVRSTRNPEPVRCEFAFFTVGGLWANYRHTSERDSMHPQYLSWTVRDIQLDNQRENAHHPVLFAPTRATHRPTRTPSSEVPRLPTITSTTSYPRPRAAAREEQQRKQNACISCKAEWQSGADLVFVESIDIDMRRFDLRLDDVFILDCIGLWGLWRSAGPSGREGNTAFSTDSTGDMPILVEAGARLASPLTVDVSQEGPKLHFKSLELKTDTIGFTFTGGSGAVGANWFANFIAAMGSMENSEVKFEKLSFHDETMSAETFKALLVNHYKEQCNDYTSPLKARGMKMVTNLDVCGNCGASGRILWSGIQDLCKRPCQESRSTAELMMAGSQGCISCMGNFTFGSCSTVSKVTNKLSEAVRLCCESQEAKAAPPPRQARNVVDGCSLGVAAMGRAVAEGAVGLLVSPTRGLEQGRGNGKPVRGLGGGCARGLVGCVVKPVIGCLDCASHTSFGFRVMAMAGISTEPRCRRRLPRMLYGPERVLRDFSQKDAELKQLLGSVDAKDGRWDPSLGTFALAEDPVWDDDRSCVAAVSDRGVFFLLNTAQLRILSKENIRDILKLNNNNMDGVVLTLQVSSAGELTSETRRLPVHGVMAEDVFCMLDRALSRFEGTQNNQAQFS